MYVVFCVLDDPAQMPAVLAGWRRAGVRSVTIIETAGGRRLEERAAQQGIPLFMGFGRMMCSGDEHTNNTFFAVVPDMETIERAVAETEAVVGDLSGPHTGIMFALPVAAAWGLPKRSDGG
jgi:nitrogen regulatory protein P-II 1